MSEIGNIKNEQNKRLETIIGILLNQSNIQKMTMGEKIALLSSQKYDNQEIADMLGTTYNTVAKEKSKAKKKGDVNG
jgi:DNA-binding CsgD family transcriptional regulator